MDSTKLSQQLARVFTALCEDTDTVVSRQALKLLSERRYGELFAMKVSPSDYEDPLSFFKDNVVVEFLRKLDIDIGLDLERRARDTFLLIERQNHATNNRLHRFANSGPFEPEDMRVVDFFDRTRKIIADWLGPIPLDLVPRHGPGSTFRDRAPVNTVPDKMTTRPTATREASWIRPLFERTAWSRSLESRGISEFEIVWGNRLATVPKDALKRRLIGVEPSINVAYQLAIGKWIRWRLRRFARIDLTYGQDLHRKLAQVASLVGEWSTVDLTNASDTLVYNLVKLLLPKKWFELLVMFRSSHTEVSGKWHRLEKFSSMGNGYTFELETMIFAALAQACAEGLNLPDKTGSGIWVYGDDIIVSPALTKTLLDCLKFVGFAANERKTFTAGPFRESCGGDFFLGKLVRAHYVKEDPIEPSQWIALANGIRRLQDGPCGVSGWDRLYKRAWHRSMDPIPNHIRRLRGPRELGDIVIHDDSWQGKHPVINGEVDLNQFTVECYRPVHKPLPWKWWHDTVQLASALYGIDSNGPIARKDGKDEVSGYITDWVAVTSRPYVA